MGNYHVCKLQHGEKQPNETNFFQICDKGPKCEYPENDACGFGREKKSFCKCAIFGSSTFEIGKLTFSGLTGEG